MNETKPALTSLGMVGPAIGIIALLLGAFGLTIDAETQAALTRDVTALVTYGVSLCSLVVGLYGRWRATKRVSGLVTPGENA